MTRAVKNVQKIVHTENKTKTDMLTKVPEIKTETYRLDPELVKQITKNIDFSHMPIKKECFDEYMNEFFNEFYVDIEERADWYRSWLYNGKYGIKDMLLGVPMAQSSKEEFMLFVQNKIGAGAALIMYVQEYCLN